MEEQVEICSICESSYSPDPDTFEALCGNMGNEWEMEAFIILGDYGGRMIGPPEFPCCMCLYGMVASRIKFKEEENGKDTS